MFLRDKVTVQVRAGCVGVEQWKMLLFIHFHYSYKDMDYGCLVDFIKSTPGTWVSNLQRQSLN